MVAFTPTPTLLLIVVTHTVLLVAALAYVGRMRRDQLEAERQLQLHAWQLAQLVPEEAREAMAR